MEGLIYEYRNSMYKDERIMTKLKQRLNLGENSTGEEVVGHGQDDTVRKMITKQDTFKLDRSDSITK